MVHYSYLDPARSYKVLRDYCVLHSEEKKEKKIILLTERTCNVNIKKYVVGEKIEVSRNGNTTQQPMSRVSAPLT